MRTPDTGQARAKPVTIRLDPAEIEMLDRKRGSVTVSAWLRAAIREGEAPGPLGPDLDGVVPIGIVVGAEVLEQIEVRAVEHEEPVATMGIEADGTMAPVLPLPASAQFSPEPMGPIGAPPVVATDKAHRHRGREVSVRHVSGRRIPHMVCECGYEWDRV